MKTVKWGKVFKPSRSQRLNVCVSFFIHFFKYTNLLCPNYTMHFERSPPLLQEDIPPLNSNHQSTILYSKCTLKKSHYLPTCKLICKIDSILHFNVELFQCSHMYSCLCRVRFYLYYDNNTQINITYISLTLSLHDTE